MPDFDVLIKGGTIVDGTRMPRYRGDLGIKDGVVRATGRLGSATAADTIDADGLVVAPGFIDLHTHYEAQLFWDPYLSISSWHGVTTVVTGNCGFGFAPVRAADRDRTMLSMTRIEAIPYASMKSAISWDWETFPDYLNTLRRLPKSINVMSYVPAGQIIAWVMGLAEAKSGRAPTEDELDAMCRVLDEAMEAGACGWSAQRTPPASGADQQRDYDGTPMVSDLMNDETALAFGKVLADRNEGFIELLMFTGDPKADQRHIEELARVSGQPILYNTVTTHEDEPNVHRSVMKWLTRCQRDGLPIFGQSVMTDAGMTFTLEDWNLWDDSPAWQDALLGTPAERRDKLADPARRQALKSQPPRLFRLDSVIVLRSPSRPEVKDLKLDEIGERLGGLHPVDALIQVAVEDNLQTVFWTTYGNTSDDLIQEMIEEPYLIPGTSDGGAHTKFFTAGRWPTEFLTKWVRDKEVLTLEEAHWAGSTLSARIAGFAQRGQLVPGAPADVIVYDLAELSSSPSEVAYDLPGDEWRRIQRANGYHRILVNGVVTFEDGKATGQHPGALLPAGQH